MSAWIFAGNHTNPDVDILDVMRDQWEAAEKVTREHIIPKLEKPTDKAIAAYVEAHPGEVARLIRDEMIAKGHHCWVLGGEE